ncbi:MCE family protein [Nocardia terpenica]|uniref:MCE family protein n=1 Tax=Nocardia terpenica TaxID=455432 RepID=A0A6G9ZD02_9NOCA|nr:MCE family protein [Nocardia terpenica]QIS23382.1 MCE family protein [Nocardia terpenica]
MRHKTIRGVLWRLGLFAAAMLALLTVIVAAITRPVGGETVSYHAEFTDVSGLKSGDDVRMFGVQVGKVTDIRLRGTRATVGLTVQRSHPIYHGSVLAIRYQSLAGQRYVDVRQPDSPDMRLRPGSVIGADKTIPSFDITQLFNGLQPVLAEFSPGAVNKFTENVLAVIQGNGSGIGPALDAFQQLSQYLTDRQTVLSAIVSNLQAISDQIGGRSPHLVTLLRGLADVFSAFREKLDGLIDYAEVAPSTLEPLNDLMATLGFTERTNPNLQADLRRVLPDPHQALELLGKLPGLLQAFDNLLPPAGASTGQIDLTCAQGKATVPGALAVLIAGQRISICQR